jgi:hypothetical protein
MAKLGHLALEGLRLDKPAGQGRGIRHQPSTEFVSHTYSRNPHLLFISKSEKSQHKARRLCCFDLTCRTEVSRNPDVVRAAVL